EIQQEAGHGGMGKVYRATDLRTGQTVALKLVRAKPGAGADRFVEEATLLSELAHPAVVRYVDHGTTAEREHYLAMEWLGGETLEERLLRGPLEILEAARLALRVSLGLEVAHRRGIIHRDVKPANLFLPGGDLAQVKVLDFGIAQRLFDA